MTLGIVEIRRHGDDGVRDGLAEIVVGCLLELLQNHRRDLGGRILLAARFDPGIAVFGGYDAVRHARALAFHLVELAPHESLDRKDGAFRIGDRLSFRDLTDEPLAVFGESNDRRRRTRTLLVHDDSGLAAFHDRHDRVCRAEVDSNDFA